MKKPTYEELLAANQELKQVIQHNELKLKKINQIAQLAFWEHNRLTEEFIASPEMNQLFNIPTRHKICFETILKALHPEDRDNFQLEIDHMVHHRAQTGKHLFRIILDDGSLRYLESKVEVIYDKNKPLKVIGITQDISDKKIAEETLVKYRFMYENSNDLICLHKPDGTYLEVSPSVRKLLGYEPAELLAQDPYTFFHPDDRSRLREESHQKALEGKIVRIRYRMRAKNDHYKWLETITDTIIENKQVKYLITSSRDISEQINLENTLRLAKEKAEESDKLKTAFLANMSHEIRTPMNGIINFSRLLLKSGVAPAKKEHYTHMIIQCGERLLMLINDILDLSILESGQIKLYPEEFNLNNLIEELFNFYNAMALEKALAFYRHCSLNNKQSIVKTDKGKIYQILSNLLNNAFKFTSKGEISFGYRLKEDRLIFYVSDTGIGIPPSLHQKIFERFRQADLELTRQYGGSGLGLTISQKLAELLDGKLYLASQSAQGSTFYLEVPYLPVFEEESPNTSTKEKPLVLVAEDGMLNYLFMEAIIEDLGMEVLHARNGKEAIELCQNHPQLAIVLLDIKMPEMNGYEAIKEIKKLNPQLPVIAQTAFATEKDQHELLRAGFDNYLCKPIDLNDLKNTLEKYV